jgi:hypothetical protein
MSKHTPTPWTIKVSTEGTPAISDSRGGHHFVKLCSPWIEGAWDDDEEAKANTTFIVQAVNSHEALVSTLKPFAAIAEVLGRTPPPGYDNDLHGWQRINGSAMLRLSDCVAALDALKAIEATS